MPRNYNSATATDNGFLTGNGIFNWLDDVVSLGLFGNKDMSTSVWNDLTGVTSQQREFEQQEYLMDKQNEYNDPSNQVARLVRAGINVNSAASQIAQNNVSATPSPVATNTNGTANAVGTIVDSVSGLSKLASEIDLNKSNASKSVADAGLSVAETQTENELRPWRIQTEKSIFNLNDSQAGLFDMQLMYYPKEAAARINLSNAQASMFKKQVDLFQSEMDKISHEIGLIDQQENYYEWLAKSQEQIEKTVKWRATIMQLYGYDPQNSIDNNMFDLGMRFGINSDQYKNGLKFINDTIHQRDQVRFDHDRALQGNQQRLDIFKMQQEFEQMIRSKYAGLGVDVVNGLIKDFGFVLNGLIKDFGFVFKLK